MITNMTNARVITTAEVAARFNELAQQEKWFEIQDELFSDHVKSIEPENSLYFRYAEGKDAIRKKGMDWIGKVEQVHETYTTQPIIAVTHFVVGRGFEITAKGFGRVRVDEIMLYEVKDGQIVVEQFFY
jgi:hypothetical protein